MCLQNLMNFHPLFKILKKQSVTAGQMDRKTAGQCENSIPPQTHFAGGKTRISWFWFVLRLNVPVNNFSVMSGRTMIS